MEKTNCANDCISYKADNLDNMCSETPREANPQCLYVEKPISNLQECPKVRSEEKEDVISGYDKFNEQIITIVLTRDKYPLLFEKKVHELMTECGLSREEAEKIADGLSFCLDLYYEEGSGLFAVETDAVESGGLKSPYSGKEIVPFAD